MITVATRNAMLATLSLTHVSLHTDEPGVDGTVGEIDVPRGVVVFSAAIGSRIYLTDNVSMSITDPVTIRTWAIGMVPLSYCRNPLLHKI